MKKCLLLLCALTLLLLSSCSIVDIFQSSTATPTLTLTPLPTFTPTVTPIPPTSTPEPTPTEDTTATINLYNDTGDMVCGIFVYPSDVETGEADNLIEDIVYMMAGASLEVEIEKGDYYMQVWDCQSNMLYSLHDFIIEDDFEWNLSDAPEVYETEDAQLIILVNERAWDICEFYIRSADSDDWGENHFYTDYGFYLTSDSTYFEEIEPGAYDFKLVYCDGTVASIQEDIEVPEGQNMTWTLTP